MRDYQEKASADKNGDGTGTGREMQTRHHFSVIDMGPPVAAQPPKDHSSSTRSKNLASDNRKERKSRRKRNGGREVDESDDFLAAKLNKLKSSSRLKTTQELVENLVPSFTSNVGSALEGSSSADVSPQGSWSQWEPPASRKRRRRASSESSAANSDAVSPTASVVSPLTYGVHITKNTKI